MICLEYSCSGKGSLALFLTKSEEMFQKRLSPTKKWTNGPISIKCNFITNRNISMKFGDHTLK